MNTDIMGMGIIKNMPDSKFAFVKVYDFKLTTYVINTLMTIMTMENARPNKPPIYKLLD